MKSPRLCADHARVRLALACSLLCLAACEPDPPDVAEPEPPAARARLDGCALSAPRGFDGEAPVLGDDALVTHAPSPTLHVLDADRPPIPVPLDRVDALDDAADGWLLAGRVADGGVLVSLGRDGAERRRMPLPHALVDAKLRVSGDRAWLFGRAGGELLLLRAELLTASVEEVRRVRVGPRALALLAADGRRAFASWTAPGAELWTLRGGEALEVTAAPDSPRALAVGETPRLVARSRERTGLWLHVGSATARATEPRARPRDVDARGLPDATALLYVSERDLWLSRVTDLGVRAEPVVVAQGPRSGQLRGDAERLWMAWEADGRSHARSARCR